MKKAKGEGKGGSVLMLQDEARAVLREMLDKQIALMEADAPPDENIVVSPDLLKRYRAFCLEYMAPGTVDLVRPTYANRLVVTAEKSVAPTPR